MFIYPDLIHVYLPWFDWFYAEQARPDDDDARVMMMMIVSFCTFSQREICQANLGDLSDLKC